MKCQASVDSKERKLFLIDGHRAMIYRNCKRDAKYICGFLGKDLISYLCKQHSKFYSKNYPILKNI